MCPALRKFQEGFHSGLSRESLACPCLVPGSPVSLPYHLLSLLQLPAAPPISLACCSQIWDYGFSTMITGGVTMGVTRGASLNLQALSAHAGGEHFLLNQKGLGSQGEVRLVWGESVGCVILGGFPTWGALLRLIWAYFL